MAHNIYNTPISDTQQCHIRHYWLVINMGKHLRHVS